MQDEQSESLITLEGDDGVSYRCQVIDMFDLDGLSYILLRNHGEANSIDPQDSFVVARLTERDNQCVIQIIESEEEFQRVIAHVEHLVKKVDELSKDY